MLRYSARKKWIVVLTIWALLAGVALVAYPRQANADGFTSGGADASPDTNTGKQVHRDKTFTYYNVDTVTGIKLYSITQELIWDAGSSTKYPWGRVYHVSFQSRPWVNSLFLWKYDGIVSDSHGWDHNRFRYVLDRTYEFQLCVLIIPCFTTYPRIVQRAYADGSYYCYVGDADTLDRC